MPLLKDVERGRGASLIGFLESGGEVSLKRLSGADQAAVVNLESGEIQDEGNLLFAKDSRLEKGRDFIEEAEDRARKKDLIYFKIGVLHNYGKQAEVIPYNAYEKME